MGDTIAESNNTLPLTCEVCGTERDTQGYTLEVVSDGEEIRESEWYFHIGGVDDIDDETGVINNPTIYSFCPECAPETAPDVDGDNFTIEGLIDELKDD